MNYGDSLQQFRPMPGWPPVIFAITVMVLLAIALAVGLVANRWVRPFAKNEVQGVKLELLISPLLTLTVLLLAFVLVQVYSDYKEARDAAALEAGRILFEYDLAGYYDESFARPMHEALLCYSRAVVHLEWPHLADETLPNETANEWAAELDVPLAELSDEDDTDQPYGTLLTVDKERSDARRLRIVNAQHTLPAEITWLLVGVSVLAVGGIAAFTLPYVSRRTQIGALVVLALALGAVQLAIVDLDGRYSGLISVSTFELDYVNERLDARFAADYPDHELACDATGRPIP